MGSWLNKHRVAKAMKNSSGRVNLSHLRSMFFIHLPGLISLYHFLYSPFLSTHSLFKSLGFMRTFAIFRYVQFKKSLKVVKPDSAIRSTAVKSL